MKKQPVFETILGLKLRLPEERVLKTKDFFVQEFVNLRKWLFFGFQHLNSRKCLETKEKVAFSDDLCFLVAGMGFEPHDLQVMSLASYRTALPRATRKLHYKPFNA